MQRLNRRGPRSYKIQVLETWVIQNLDCEFHGVPLYEKLQDRENTAKMCAEPIPGWSTYKPGLTEDSFLETCKRILHTHSVICHQGVEFDPRYLLEEMCKIQTAQEEYHRVGLQKKSTIVRCSRCVQLLAAVEALKLPKMTMDDVMAQAKYKLMADAVDERYAFHCDGSTKRVELLAYVNSRLQAQAFDKMEKSHPIWRRLIRQHLKHADRPGYRPLKLQRREESFVAEGPECGSMKG